MRMGKFYIDMFEVENNPHEVFSLIKFVPYRVECLHYNAQYEYIGTSPLFREVPAGEVMPEYDLQINRDEAGDISQVLAQERIT